MKYHRLSGGVVLALLVVGGAASAQVPAYDLTAAGYTGNFNWTGQLGLAFDATAPVQISALGAFDSGQDGFGGTVTAKLWNRDTQTLIASQAFSGTTVATAGTLNGDHRFISLVTPLTLSAGHYLIAGQNFAGVDRAGLAPIGGGFIHDTFNSGGLLSIAAITTGYYSEQANPNLYPGFTSGSDNLWTNSASFLFQAPGSNVTVTPEPGSVTLLCGLLMTGAGFTARRRRNRK